MNKIVIIVASCSFILFTNTQQSSF